MKIENEKNVILSNQEEETKQILMRMMTHLKVIKQLRCDIKDIETQRRYNTMKELEVIEAFKFRQTEIELMNNMGQLSKILKYSNALGLVQT